MADKLQQAIDDINQAIEGMVSLREKQMSANTLAVMAGHIQGLEYAIVLIEARMQEASE